MKVSYITNSSQYSGVGHRAFNIRKHLSKQHTEIKTVKFKLDGKRGLLSKNGRPISWIKKWPGLLGSKSVNWIRLGSKMTGYIKRKDKNQYDLFHATNQSLSWLAPRFEPFLLTVHDIIELNDSQDKKASILNKYLYNGITKARHIVSVSNYTKEQLQKQLNIPPSEITVIHNGVSPKFHQIINFLDSIAGLELRKSLKLNQDTKVILFVGSDHPRKNAATAIRAFTLIKKEVPNSVFIKIGEPGISQEREKLLDLISKHRLKDSVRLISNVTTEDLVLYYNLADVLLFPSKNEGFGLPALQAMACGLPVVAANATSLPEIVGDAALLINPDEPNQISRTCLELLQDKTKSESLSQSGLARAEKFSWQEAANKLAATYQTLTD